MRVAFSRTYVVLALIFLLYLFIRNSLFPVQRVVQVGQKSGTPNTPPPPAPVETTARKNLDLEVERVTEIVNKLSEKTLPNTFQYGFELLPERPKQAIVPSTPTAEAEASFYKYIQSLQMKCPKKVRVGRKEDGGWDACVAGPFSISSPCLVYSIGMGGEWSFDHMITNEYRCLDMAYDPTLGKPDHKPKQLLWFYNTGLGGSNMVNDKKWRLRTFGKLLEENGHLNKTIDILKIDIEYSEWSSLRAILEEGSLENVKQLMVEFHTMEVRKGKHSSSSDYSYYWQILRGLDKVGFKTWHYLATPTGHYKSTHSGADTPCCANVCLVNTKYLV